MHTYIMDNSSYKPSLKVPYYVQEVIPGSLVWMKTIVILHWPTDYNKVMIMVSLLLILIVTLFRMIQEFGKN